MSLWQDLSSLVKRYIIVAVVLVGALLALRTCVSPQQGGSVPPRGLSR